MNNILTEIQDALRAAGHGANEVQNSPVDMLNFFRDDKGRAPTATITYDPGQSTDHGTIVWGHHWEHEISTSVGVNAIIAKILETTQES